MAQLIATGPIVGGQHGMAAKRVVLKLERDNDGSPREFIVHNQYFYEDGSTAYGDGSYFPILNEDYEIVQGEAWKRFQDRQNRSVLGMTFASIEADPERFQSILESHNVPGKG